MQKRQSFSLKTLKNKNFQTIHLSPIWLQTIGEVERNFKMIIYGASGSGKTTFAMRLCAELAQPRNLFNS